MKFPHILNSTPVEYCLVRKQRAEELGRNCLERFDELTLKCFVILRPFTLISSSSSLISVSPKMLTTRASKMDKRVFAL